MRTRAAAQQQTQMAAALEVGKERGEGVEAPVGRPKEPRMSVVPRSCMRVCGVSQASSSHWRAAGMGLVRSEAPCAKSRLRNSASQICDGQEGEDGAGDGDGDWVFWFEGG